METLAGQGALHNMSAPPRMRITLRPLVRRRERNLLGSLFGLGSREVTVNGMRCLGSSGFPGRRGEEEIPDPVSALLEVLGGERPPEEEAAEERLLAALAELDPRALGLPPFALAVPVTGAPPPAGWDGPLLPPPVALALLSRTAGGVFLAARFPRLAVEEWLEGTWSWYTPLPGDRS